MSVHENDLFDNPLVRQAKQNMSAEDIERYKKIGEEMYKNIDFESEVLADQGNIINTITPEMKEGIYYIEAQFKSGLHPSMLEEHEKIFLKDCYGEEWYLKWGYVKEDLTQIVTLK